MDRRTFGALATACMLCWTRRLSANIIPGAEPINPAEPGPAAPSTIPIEPERFPVSLEEYKSIDPDYLPQLVSYPTNESPGTVIIDTDTRYLYLVLGSNQAKRYGIGVGRDGFGWSGSATIERKTKWPMWFPPKEMQYRDREARRWRRGMRGGPRNPLGARALYLFQGRADTLFRIHGTRDPKSIGRAVSSGCIRMLNADVVDLFDRVSLGTKVVVLPSARPVAQTKPRRTRNAAVERRRRRTALYRRYYRRRYGPFFGLFGW
jgi:lipoprotein-anchoring transpeptidase ErfK/SrfK